MSHELNYRRTLGEICVGPHIERPGNVGLLLASLSSGGWCELTPAEARDLGNYLLKAAAEAAAPEEPQP